MTVFTPALSVSLAPLIARCGSSVVRGVESLAAQRAIRSVQLSAAQPGLRPRDLDGGGRKELLSLLSRQGLSVAGLDLMIPHKDYLNAATQDRAFAAVMSAVELAADLGRVPLCLSLPVKELPGEFTHALLVAADGRGVTVAVHAEHDLDSLEKWLAQHDQPVLRAALDPAALLASGHDPAATAIRFARRLAVARLDDYADTSVSSSGGRCVLGTGELDPLAYRAALSTATKLQSLVLELRDLRDPLAAIPVSLRAWEEAGL